MRVASVPSTQNEMRQFSDGDDSGYRVQDISGSRVCDVEALDDVIVARILALLVERIEIFRSTARTGRSCRLQIAPPPHRLPVAGDQQTLAEAGVQPRAMELQALQPEITAGATIFPPLSLVRRGEGRGEGSSCRIPEKALTLSLSRSTGRGDQTFNPRAL